MEIPALDVDSHMKLVNGTPVTKEMVSEVADEILTAKKAEKAATKEKKVPKKEKKGAASKEKKKPRRRLHVLLLLHLKSTWHRTSLRSFQMKKRS